MKHFALCLLLFSVAFSQALNTSCQIEPRFCRESNVTSCLSPCSAPVCFGVDSSTGLTSQQFALQKQFLEKTLQLQSRRTNASVAAVAYGIANEIIFELTSNFSLALELASNLSFREDPSTSLSAPIVYCDSVLREQTGKDSRIVLLTSGRMDLGGDPVPRAQVFRERSGGKIIVVALRERNRRVLEDISGSDSPNLFWLTPANFCTVLEDVNTALCETEG